MAGRAVAILTGLILLFASLTKGLALADTTVNSDRVPGDWWLSLAASVFEPNANSVNCSVTYYNNSSCLSQLPNGNTGILRTGTVTVSTCQ